MKERSLSSMEFYLNLKFREDKKKYGEYMRRQKKGFGFQILTSMQRKSILVKMWFNNFNSFQLITEPYRLLMAIAEKHLGVISDEKK